MILKIIKEQNDKIDKILKENKAKLEKIIAPKFKEFKVTVTCYASDYDEVELYQEDRWIRFRLATSKYSSYRYDKNRQGKEIEGLYVRKSQKGGDKFSKSEIKELQKRLNDLFE